MAKKVFFSFHYQDVIDFRANVVRKHNALQSNQEAGYFDESIWEENKRTSSLALKKLINKELIGTSVTCVLIGSETYQRKWVIYEIFRSLYKGNKLIGVHINSIKGRDGKIKPKGRNPFDYLGIYFNEDGSKYAFITKENDGKWHYWIEIDSESYHNNDIFDKGWAKRNAKKCISLSSLIKVYDWVDDDGYNNFKDWVA